MDRLPTETPEPLVPSEPADNRISIQIDEPFLAEVDVADLAHVVRRPHLRAVLDRGEGGCHAAAAGRAAARANRP